MQRKALPVTIQDRRFMVLPTADVYLDRGRGWRKVGDLMLRRVVLQKFADTYGDNNGD